MIIKITPENDIERAQMEEVEHTGVKEFFIFGNKQDGEGESLDFHDWKGSYRYLVGSLYYFTGMLSDEQSSKASNAPTEIKVNAVPQIEAEPKTPFIKKSGTEDGQIEGVVEVKADSPQFKVLGNDEIPNDEEDNDNSKGAEE